MIRRIAVVVALLSVGLCAIPAQAQVPPAPEGLAPDAPPLQLLGRYLELSQDQVNRVRELMETRRIMVGPLSEQIEVRNKALRDLFASGSPDAGMVGRLTIEIHGLRQQIEAALQQFRKGFEGLLSEAQVGKLRLLRQAARLEPVVRAARDLGIVK